MRPEAVLIVGGGALQAAVVEAVQARGLAALVTDRNPHCVCAPLADAWLPLDTYDTDGHRQLPRRLAATWRLRGVCTAGADVAPSVASAAAAARTPGLPVAVASLTHHKFDVRCALTAAGLDVYQPGYRWVDLHDPRQPYDAALALRQACDWPLVLKPVESCASRGVSLVYAGRGAWGDGLAEAIRRARPYGRYALLEEGLRGSEHSAEVIFDAAGQVIFWNVVDRVFRYDHGIPLEVGHLNPSRLPAASLAAIQTVLVKTAQALGVGWGPWKVDLMVTADGPKLLEGTARLSGGWDCQLTTPLSSGRSPIAVVVDLARGVRPRPEDLAVSHARTAACLAAFPAPGRVVSTRDVETLTLPAGDRVVLAVQPGDVIVPYTHCATRPAFAICVDVDPEAALARAHATAATVAAALHTEPL